VGEPFAAGSQSLLFEGIDLRDGRSVLIKQAAFDYRRSILLGRREAASRREAIRVEHQVLQDCTTGHLPEPIALLVAPAILPVARDFLVLREETYLVQEWLRGVTLEAAALRVWKNHPMERREVWARRVAGEFLTFWTGLRARGHFYGDISARNILLEEGSGRVRVVDAACSLPAREQVVLREATPAFLTPGLFAAAREGRPVPGDEATLLPMLAKVLHFSLTCREPENGGEPSLEDPALASASEACREALRTMLRTEHEPASLPGALALVRSWIQG
jgi:hypothetical protein